MERTLLKDYLQRSGMEAVQAEALSRVRDDMDARLTTKTDLAELRFELKADIVRLESRMESRMDDLESRLDTKLLALKAELKVDIAALRIEANATKAELTWRMVAVVGFFATAVTLLNAFIG